jgi:hypothetical protein
MSSTRAASTRLFTYPEAYFTMTRFHWEYWEERARDETAREPGREKART